MYELNELQQFFIFIIEGILISFIFDFFRSIRKNFKSGNLVTHIEDITFLSFVSIIFIFSIMRFCNGIIRFYIFLALFIGISLYALTLSKKCVIMLYEIVKLCKIFFTFLLKNFKRLGKLFNL